MAKKLRRTLVMRLSPALADFFLFLFCSLAKSTGKSYTLFGPPNSSPGHISNESGIVQRTMDVVFKNLKVSQGWVFFWFCLHTQRFWTVLLLPQDRAISADVSLSFLAMYPETMEDLLHNMTAPAQGSGGGGASSRNSSTTTSPSNSGSASGGGGGGGGVGLTRRPSSGKSSSPSHGKRSFLSLSLSPFLSHPSFLVFQLPVALPALSIFASAVQHRWAFK